MKNAPAQYPVSKLFVFIWLSMFACTASVNAQSPVDTGTVKNLLSAAAKYNNARPAEKLYLNFDKPYYAVGDTAWFKAYVLTANTRAYSTRSAKLYVEVMSADGKLAQRLVLPVFDGLAQGYLPLTEKTIPEGSYTIRAYTNWLQNFGTDYFFYKQFNVGSLAGKTWLLTEQHQLALNNDSSKVQLAMRFSDTKSLPLVTRKVSVKIQEGSKTLLKSEMTTGVDGTVNGNFMLPAKADKRNLSIQVEDAADKSQRIVFPFYPNGAGGDIDLQFLPEGGNLVTGLYNKVGFKVLGEDGLSREIKGIIVNNKGEDIAELQTTRNGMGNFMLVPQPGETYMAKVMVNGKEKRFPLPVSKGQGLAVRVDGINHPDELYVYISSAANDSRKYMLLAESRGEVYFGSAFTLNGEGYFNTHIAKGAFHTGIISLTILGPDNRPVAQRRVFIDHHDALQISQANATTTYHAGDSIALAMNVISSSGAPAQGSFSVSVTDDAQIKNALPTDNIQSHILLASELKGYIENPAWYFTKGDEKLKEKALDNLLLTQGWQGFDWGNINQPAPVPAFQPETEIGVTGTLRNLFNKPAAGIKVRLMATGKQFLLVDTISDKQGRFAFKDLPLADSIAYVIKLHNGKDKSAAEDIKVDEFMPTKLTLPNLPRPMPWNMNTDTTLINYISKSKQRAREAELFINPTGSTLLKNVSVKAQRVTQIINNEFATEIDVIDEKTIVAEKKISLLELLEKYLKGTLRQSNSYAIKLSGDSNGRVLLRPTKQFVVGSMRINDFVIDGQSLGELTMSLRDPQVDPVIKIIDGKEQTRWMENADDADTRFFASANSFLNAVGADDVKKISVFRGRFISVVITTRSGAGLSTHTSIGTYAYHPLPMQLPRQFYSPKYIAKNTAPDLRSTIHWEPNLITDDKGNAHLSFFAADKPGTYTVNIEGTDLLGHFGVSSQKIVIK